MKKIRNVLAFLLSLAMMASLIACGDGNTSSGSGQGAQSQGSGSEESSGYYEGTRAINLVVPFAAGGGTDLLAVLWRQAWRNFCPVPLM